MSLISEMYKYLDFVVTENLENNLKDVSQTCAIILHISMLV